MIFYHLKVKVNQINDIKYGRFIFDLILNGIIMQICCQTKSNRAKDDWDENGMIWLDIERNNAKMESNQILIIGKDMHVFC